MRVLQQVFVHQLLEIALLHFGTQLRVGLVGLDVDERLTVIVHPAAHGLQAVHEPLGEASEIRLAVPELIVVDGRQKGLLVESLLHDFRQRLPDSGLELFLSGKGCPLGHHAEIRLLQVIVIDAEHILAYALVDQRFLQRRPGHGAEGEIQNLERHVQLPVQRVAHGLAPCQIRVLVHILSLADWEFPDPAHRLGKGRLGPYLGVHGQRVKGRQIVLVDELQLLGHVHIAVEVDIAVRRMIIGPVEIQELLIGQLRNGLGISAGLKGIGGMGIQRRAHLPVQHAVGGGESALHLIVDYAVVGKFPLTVQLIVPALLAEDGLLLIDVGIEHRVQVHMHQILKILVVAAGHGVDRVVRVGHGVQECVQGTFRQFDERILDGELLRAAEHGMLQDMRHAGGILRGGAEADVEHLVFIIVGYQCHSGTGLPVPAQIGHTVDVRYLPSIQDLVARQFFYFHFSLLYGFIVMCITVSPGPAC